MSDWSPVQPVSPAVQNICSKMKSQVESMAETNFAVYIPVDFISKDEGATNYTYIVKVNTGRGQCVHAKIYQSGGGELNVEKILYPKALSDPLIPF